MIKVTAGTVNQPQTKIPQINQRSGALSVCHTTASTGCHSSIRSTVTTLLAST